MKIILLEDVKSLGKAGEIVEVSNGYARNMLLPKKLGVEATPKNLNDLKLKKAHAEKIESENLAAAKSVADQINGAVVEIPIKTGENNKVFGSVSAKEIAEEANKQLGVELDKKKLVLPSVIKELGDTKVPVKLHPKVTAEIIVRVVPA